MAHLKSAIDRRSPEFEANASAMRAQLAVLAAKLEAAAQGGGVASRQRHEARGKLFVRDRIDLLLDPGSPFLEICALAAHGLYGGDAHAAGIVAGMGRVSGRECMIVGQRRDRQRRHLLPADGARSTCAPRTSRGTTACPASTSSIRAAPSCRSRTRSSPTSGISGASSIIRRKCRRWASRRSRL